MTASNDSTDLMSVIDKIPLLKIILSSAGVVGLLVAIGYVVDAAQQNLLGIDISDVHDTADYALLGGGFFIDILRVMSEHTVIVGVLITLITVAAILADRLRLRVGRRWPVAPWFVGLIAIVIAYSVKTLLLDVPYMRMSDLLNKPPICEGSARTQQERWEHDTWERFVCGRSKRDPTLNQRLEANRIHCSQDFTWSAWQRSKQPLAAAFQSRLSIAQEFTINLFLTGFLTYCVLLLYTTATAAGLSSLATNVLRVGLLALMGVNVLALPYIYGKVIRGTDMPSGRVIYTAIDQPENVACLIIGADDRFVTFYDYESDQPKFVQIARSKVHQLTIDSSDDLVAKRMVYFLDSSRCQ